jgi:hypothetical protein
MSDPRRVRSKSTSYGIFAHPPVAAVIMDMLPIISQMAMFRALPELRDTLSGWNIHARFTQQLLALTHARWAPTNSLAQELISLTWPFSPLSGSAVLSVLLGSPFLPNDLDYITRHNWDASEQVRSPSQWLATFHDGHVWHTTQQYDDVTSAMIDHVDNVDATFPRDDFEDYHPRCMFHVQTICIRDTMPDEFVRDFFDLDFLRNTYTSEKLCVMKPFAVLHRTSELDVSRYCRPTEGHSLGCWVSRYKRYVHDRGFHITPCIKATHEDLLRIFQDRLAVDAAPGTYRNLHAVSVKALADWKQNVYGAIVRACAD